MRKSAKYLIIFFLNFVVLILSINAQKDWTQIKVLQSTRDDVEKMLGQPFKKPNNSFFAAYKAEGGNLYVEYSLGLCEPDDKGGWNVEKGVVVEMGFFPDVSPTLKSLKLDKKKFKKSVQGDVADIYSYTDENAGIEYTVQDGIVENITYFPTKKYEHLRCSIVNGFEER